MTDNSQARAVMREADKLFKQVETKKVMTEYERVQQSRHLNRERLKAERLAREVETTGRR
jgi:hypothetical protein